jgi:hypothetical protein
MIRRSGRDRASGSSGGAPFAGRASRIALARVLVLVGIALYNWWIVVAVQGRLLTNSDEFFSDLEAVGRPDANVLQNLDFIAGLTLLAALLLRGSRGPPGARCDMKWDGVFSIATGLGGRFAYACSEGLIASCRSAEWHLRLPAHHYVHVVVGIVEFAAATFSVYLAWQRTRTQRTAIALGVKSIGVSLLVGYPLLAVAYLSDGLGAYFEPIFFVSFSLMVAIELFERSERR